MDIWNKGWTKENKIYGSEHVKRFHKKQLGLMASNNKCFFAFFIIIYSFSTMPCWNGIAKTTCSVHNNVSAPLQKREQQGVSSCLALVVLYWTSLHIWGYYYMSHLYSKHDFNLLKPKKGLVTIAPP